MTQKIMERGIPNKANLLDYDITEEEYNMLEKLAKSRNNSFKADIKYSSLWNETKDTLWKSHMTGVTGEYIFSRHGNLKLDRRIFENAGDAGTDFLGIEIKSTRSNRPCLRIKKRDFINKYDQIKALGLCYVRPDFRYGYLIGGISKKRFETIKNVTNKWNNDFYEESAEHLTSFTKETIMEFIDAFYNKD